MWRRAIISAIGATSIALLTAGVAHAVAVSGPDPSSEAAFVQRIGAERSAGGVGVVRVAADLVAVARQHATDMANQQRLFDDQNLGNEVQNWQAVAENSGTGPSVDAVDQAFMASPPHRSIILDPRFTEVGVGVVWTGQTMWVAEVFRQPLNSSAPAAPSASPRPTSSSAPTTAPPTTPSTAPGPRPVAAAHPSTSTPTTTAPVLHTATLPGRGVASPTTAAAPTGPTGAAVAGASRASRASSASPAALATTGSATTTPGASTSSSPPAEVSLRTVAAPAAPTTRRSSGLAVLGAVLVGLVLLVFAFSAVRRLSDAQAGQPEA